MSDMASNPCRRPGCRKPFAEHAVYHDAPPDPPPPEGLFDFPTSGVYCPSPKAATQPAEAHTHLLEFRMPRCMKHFFKGHKWWCRACDRATEREMRDVVHVMWELQGAGDRIVRVKGT